MQETIKNESDHDKTVCDEDRKISAETLALAAAQWAQWAKEDQEEKQMKQQKPSIGRIVHYQRYGSPGGEFKPEPSPAIVTAIHEDGDCQLFVMNPNGVYHNKTPYSKDPIPGHWSWPPYTKEEVDHILRVEGTLSSDSNP